MSSELLAIVQVNPDQRVRCQAPGCGHGVYQRIHVVRHDGRVGVYGSDCFRRLFAGVLVSREARFGGGASRPLTAEERDLLAFNTVALINRFELELEQKVAQAKVEADLRTAHVEQQRQATVDRLRALKSKLLEQQQPMANAPMSQRELIALAQARQRVRQQYGVDPDQPGWAGLVQKIKREILASSK